jgi:hypothetical protein
VHTSEYFDDDFMAASVDFDDLSQTNFLVNFLIVN